MEQQFHAAEPHHDGTDFLVDFLSALLFVLLSSFLSFTALMTTIIVIVVFFDEIFFNAKSADGSMRRLAIIINHDNLHLSGES